MTRRTPGRARAIRGAAVGLLLLCAGVAGAQLQGLMQFGISVECEVGTDKTPVLAELIPVKPSFDLELPDKKPEPKTGIVIYNLDIYGVRDKKRVSVGSQWCRPKSLVLIFHWTGGTGQEPRIYYWVPPSAGSGKGKWVTHEQVVAAGKQGLGGMEVSRIVPTGKPGEYSFEIRQWPQDDRMMCHGN